MSKSRFESFGKFYEFYLLEHKSKLCRRMHFVGSTAALFCLAALIVTGQPAYIAFGLFAGYGFAWIGHFVFEKNQPATFKYPLYSFIGDWKMYGQMWVGKIDF